MDRFRELEFFVQVVSCGSLSKAAETLGLSNAAASRLLSSLETRLSTRLVERNTRRLYLTGEGRDFYERSCRILAELSEAETNAMSASQEPSGLLRVSASLSFSVRHIAPRLPDFARRYPRLRVHVESANRYLDLIDEGIDVAVRTREFEPDKDITIRRLAATRRVLAASPRYLAEHGVPAQPQDLVRHALLLYVHARNHNTLSFAKDGQTTAVTVSGLLESNDGQILRAAALEGMGILVQPSYIVYDDIVSGHLVPIFDDWELPGLQINIAYPSSKHLSAKVRCFIDFMVEEFARHDYERKWCGPQGFRR